MLTDLTNSVLGPGLDKAPTGITGLDQRWADADQRDGENR